jgi:hypothetical protein
MLDQCFFFGGRNIAKFRPEKYGFHLYKGFSMKKMAQIRQISNKKVPDHHIFMISHTR